MNILRIIPGVNKLFSKKNIDNEIKDIITSKLNDCDIEQLKSYLIESQKLQSLTNSSLFVSGAIPSLLWMMVFIIFFNYIIVPVLISIGLQVPLLELPKWYSDLCSTIALGLFAKKAWESTDMSLGKFQKKSKYESESQTNINVKEKEKELSNCNSEEIIKTEIITLNPFDIDSAVDDNANLNYDDDETDNNNNYNDPDYINERLNQMTKK